MNKVIKNDNYRLRKIHFFCDSILDFINGITIDEFKRNEQINFAISFALIQIGEEASKITMDFREYHSHIPWPNLIGMRHRIVHDYSGSKMKILWETATISIPQLLEEINKILKTGDDSK